MDFALSFGSQAPNLFDTFCHCRKEGTHGVGASKEGLASVFGVLFFSISFFGKLLEECQKIVRRNRLCIRLWHRQGKVPEACAAAGSFECTNLAIWQFGNLDFYLDVSVTRSITKGWPEWFDREWADPTTEDVLPMIEGCRGNIVFDLTVVC
ncbi:hypothetical protein Pyn_26691 [Prunus yedoensis var. nudiflora]|uniref:Uncharacterized protein n=1 Tax=Prunus yedoensis var. nudiflora TaxID=2094558 RepID=A0A315A0Y0_PRUYE|nr:hypothetical protein Pyn_26691 [Prunus yedoensis var. nudiflora]